MAETYVHPTLDWPKLVDVVALGETCRTDYLEVMLAKGDALPPAHEVWAVNRGLRLFRSDVAFVLDEIEHEAEDDPAYGSAMKDYIAGGGKIITTKSAGIWRNSPAVVDFPARLVRACFDIHDGHDPYWHNSIPMILAYAQAIGVEHVRLWGADYTLPGGRVLESDRACCEYWIGRCVQAGMIVALSPNTTLCNQRQRQDRTTIYGLRSDAPHVVAEWLSSGPAGLGEGAATSRGLPKEGKTIGDVLDAMAYKKSLEQLSQHPRVARADDISQHEFAGDGQYCLRCGTHLRDQDDRSCRDVEGLTL